MSENQRQELERYETFENFAAAYSFKDSAEVYSNGVMMIPVFRVKQWLEAKGIEGPAEVKVELNES